MAGTYTRTLHVVFALDTTWSMERSFGADGKTILDRMNELVEKFLLDIVQEPELSKVTKVSFLTFADGVTMESGFHKPSELKAEHFVAVTGRSKIQRVHLELSEQTNQSWGQSSRIMIPRFESIGEATSSRIGLGVMRALEKLDEEQARIRVKTEDQGKAAKFYIPILVLITDGAPKVMRNGELKDTCVPSEEENAKERVRQLCIATATDKKTVFPVICGIGDEAVEQHLKGYSVAYEQGFQHIGFDNLGKGFSELFEKIKQSITESYRLSELVEKSRAQNSFKKTGYNPSKKQEQYRAVPRNAEYDDYGF